MTYLRALAHLVSEVLRYGVAARRIWLPLLITVGIVLVVLVAVVKVTVPVLLYPMA